MHLTIRPLLAGAVTLAIVAAWSGGSHAQSYPTRPVRVIVPFGAGGGTDIQGRLLSRKFHESMGQSFLVDNRPGASGLIGAEIAARSPPDGYTILFTTASMPGSVSLYKKVAFDPVKDLQPISLVSSAPLVLVVHPSVPAKSAKELVALAKKQKGRMNAASNGSGISGHFAIEMLKQMVGVDVVHIPYKGGGPAITAVIGGEADFFFSTPLTAKSHIESGRVRALAVTTAKRFSTFPELPTMNSLYPGFEMDTWYAMFFPAGTPKEIVAKMNAEIVKALKSPDVREFIMKEGGEPASSTPEEMSGYLKRDMEKYARIIKAGNIRPE